MAAVAFTAAVASVAVVASMAVVGFITAFPSAAVASAAAVGFITAFPSAAGTLAEVGTAATTMVGGIITIGGGRGGHGGGGGFHGGGGGFSVLAETRSDSLCLVELSGLVVRRGQAAIIFSLAIGMAFRKVCIGVLPKHQRP